MKFMANDGTIFDDITLCQDYEKKLEIKKAEEKQKQIYESELANIKSFNIAFENCTMQDIYTWFIIQDGGVLLIINIILFIVTFIYFSYSYKSRESFILRCQMLD